MSLMIEKVGRISFSKVAYNRSGRINNTKLSNRNTDEKRTEFR